MCEDEDRFGATVSVLPGVGPKRAEQLAQLGLATVGDVVLEGPRRFIDRRTLTPLADVTDDGEYTVEAEIVSAKTRRLRRGLTLTEAVLRDDSGTLRAQWFGRAYLARALPEGARGVFHGQGGNYKGVVLKNAEYELLDAADGPPRPMTPVYRTTEGLTQRQRRKLVQAALEFLGDAVPDALPQGLALQHGFAPAAEALGIMHFPPDEESARQARSRFAYEELLAIQVGLLQAKARRHDEAGRSHAVDGPKLEALRDSLPFDLTGAQRQAVDDILADLAAPRPMVRLLQGDVGCGKTVVALHAVAAAADGGWQTAFMAPTEILAEQHGLTLKRLLEPLGLRVAVLTGSTPGAGQLRTAIETGYIHVVVGTHALIQERSVFHKLGLVVVDEQHRFGVLQRQALAEKGEAPDMLHMTATPIPRTLAITVYGGMDLTIIGELPPGRQPVVTRRLPEGKVPGLYGWLHEQAAKGCQAYYICPLVEESERVEAAAVTERYETLAAGPLEGLRVGLLHGRMPSAEKDAVMAAFRDGELDVLFATTVIEVGVDCPQATTLVIEDAGQFGLTQLHQLRGRVGRSAEQSYCFLLGKPKTADARTRLRVLEKTTDGFVIAEEDLKLRGPGEFQGVRQAGLSDLRMADLLRDVRLLDAARKDAAALIEGDPALEKPEHAALAKAAQKYASITA